MSHVVEILRLVELLAGIVKGPSIGSVENILTLSKYDELRYMLHKPSGKIWIVNAELMTHGLMADEVGLSRQEWFDDTLTGFIHRESLPGIKIRGLRDWIISRHAIANDDYIDASAHNYELN